MCPSATKTAHSLSFFGHKAAFESTVPPQIVLDLLENKNCNNNTVKCYGLAECNEYN